MTKKSSYPLAIFMLFCMLAGGVHVSLAQEDKISVLVVSGGHGFEQQPFYEVFNSITSITYDTLVQPRANEVIASPEIQRYDVLVFYDMFDSISPAQQEAYVNLLKKKRLHDFHASFPGILSKLAGVYKNCRRAVPYKARNSEGRYPECQL